MKVSLSLRNSARGRNFITRVQDRKRQDSVLKMLESADNSLAIKYPAIHKQIASPQSFLDDILILLNLLPTEMPKSSSKRASAFRRYRY